MADYDSIAQGVRPLTDPTIQMHNAASAVTAQEEAKNAVEQRKILKQQQTENDLKIQQQDRAAKDQQIFSDVLQEAGDKHDQIVPMLMKRGASPGMVFGAQKTLMDQRKEAATMDAAERTALQGRHEQLRGILQSVDALPDENARAQAWPQALQQAIQSGAVSPQEAQGVPPQYPGQAWLKLHNNMLGTSGSILAEQSKRAEMQFKEAETQKNAAQALEAGAKTAETQGKTAEAQRMQAAPVLAQALQNGGMEAYQAALDQMPRGIAKHFENAKTADDVLKIGMTANEAVKADIEKQTRRDTVAHQLKQEGFEAQRVGLEGARNAREQKIYEQTYGSGSNPALVGVEPKLRSQAASAAAKVITEFENGKKSADDIQTVLDLTKAGNKAAGANVPLVGVGALNAINGIKRMNKAEIDQYGGAGSLLDKIQGKLGGLVSGQPIPPDVLKDMETLHNTLRGNLEKGANDKLGGVNQTYRSNFTLPKSTSTGGSGKVRLLAPDGSRKEVDPSEVDHYKKLGAKVIQ